MEILELTACELARAVARRDLSASEAAVSALERIELVDPSVGAFLRPDPEGALKAAGEIDRRIAAGEDPGPLAGVPVGLKDNLCVRGREITCGSRILAGFRAPYDAAVVERLRKAGAVFLGQLNMDEFAMGSSNENSAYGPVRNPWDLSRVPGGSSGGAAAAVAARECPLSLGSDTGGSIRQPAALCGVAGLKPTYGRVSRYGLIAYASSLDQIGPFGKTVEDIALALEVIAGPDPRDSTSAPVEVPRYRELLSGDLGGKRLGVPRECFSEGMEPGVERVFREALEVFRGAGAEVREIDLPRIPHSVACYYILSTAEASSNLARFDGVQYGLRRGEKEGLVGMYSRTRREGFGEEVKRRIMLGTYVLSAGYYEAYYAQAQKVRRLIKEDFDRAFSACDCVLMPTSPVTAFEFGERTADPLSMYLSDIFTIGVNLAGLPGISINCGFDEKNLPVGLQVIAPPFQELRLLGVARGFEQRTSHHLRRPPLPPASGGPGKREARP